MNTIPAAFLLINAAGNIVYHSKTMKECYGSDEQRQWTDVNALAETTHRVHIALGQSYHKSQYPLVRALKEGVTVKAEHTNILREDKTTGTFAITAAPFPHCSGYIIAFLVDVTNQVNVEKELLEAKLHPNSVEQLQTRSKFVAITSHEIRTPVNGMIGLCELLLLEDELTERQREYAMDIRDCSLKLSNIINNFLDFRKLDDKKVVSEVLKTDLRGLIESIVKDSVKQTHRHNPCVVEIAEDLPSYIVCDGFRISQIVSNLLDNAHKFVCQDGTVELKVLLQTTTTGEKRVQFRVHNDGLKISDDTATRIFQPFIQADARITREYGGTGLGLSICRELSSLMDGNVYIDQSIQTGCTFVFELPIRSEADVASKMSIIITQQALPSILTFRVRHILLVEDEPINQRVIKRLISRCGIRCSLAGNGREGFQKFIADPTIEMILMDCKH